MTKRKAEPEPMVVAYIDQGIPLECVALDDLKHHADMGFDQLPHGLVLRSWLDDAEPRRTV